jgi:uncharacterized protein (DUF433 family)
MKLAERIEVNSGVMVGKPVIAGTRISVELILRKMSEGTGVADILEAYPQLTLADVYAVLAYAADTVSLEETLVS